MKSLNKYMNPYNNSWATDKYMRFDDQERAQNILFKNKQKEAESWQRLSSLILKEEKKDNLDKFVQGISDWTIKETKKEKKKAKGDSIKTKKLIKLGTILRDTFDNGDYEIELEETPQPVSPLSPKKKKAKEKESPLPKVLSPSKAQTFTLEEEVSDEDDANDWADEMIRDEKLRFRKAKKNLYHQAIEG